MLKTIKQFLQSRFSHSQLLPLYRLKNALFGYRFDSYSQSGEDRLLLSILNTDRPGFFVDVGAHHPFRYSNTYLLYKRGWRGINIDPLPGMLPLFNRKRPRDINLNCGIGSIASEMAYYCFNEPAVNTFVKELAEERFSPASPFQLKEIISVSVLPLRDVLTKHLPTSAKRIDVLNIDAEGFDFDILKSNDFERFRPNIILIEAFESHIDSITDYLTNLDYKLISWCGGTFFFEDQKKQ